MTAYAGSRRLLRAWLVLVGLTLLSMTGTWPGPEQVPWLWALLLTATAVKVHQVLTVYLGLRCATPGWRGLFIGLTAVMLLLIASGYFAAHLQH